MKIMRFSANKSLYTIRDSDAVTMIDYAAVVGLYEKSIGTFRSRVREVIGQVTILIPHRPFPIGGPSEPTGFRDIQWRM